MRKPRILIYDLEITPTLGWTYDLWDTNVIRVERHPYIMCFAYKWYGDKKVHCISQTDFEKHYKKNPHDDSLVVKELWALLDEADVVIAHNAAKFDNRVSNERFLSHRLGPPSPYKTVDTLQVARRYFRNGSNSLNNLCEKLGIGSKAKDKHSELWHDCVFGDKSAWRKMVAYCKQDVVVLDALYTELRPFMPNHPNVSEDVAGCPKCGSKNVQSRGTQRSATTTYRRLHCQDCGGWSRARLPEKADKPELVSI